MSNTTQRVIVGAIMALVGGAAALGEYFGFPAVRYLGILVVLGMIAEMIICTARTPRETLRQNKNWLVFGAFFVWLFVMLAAINHVGTRPWIILWMLMIIVGADVGAWGFGKLLGGDKMWERLSAGKTWSGQIAGIICGTAASVLYGLLGTDAFMPQLMWIGIPSSEPEGMVYDAFMPQLMWIGISVSLLSQYGDLTASMIKRRMGIKDFGNILPGHGGLLDRFDGWIYVLPLIWLVML